MYIFRTCVVRDKREPWAHEYTYTHTHHTDKHTESLSYTHTYTHVCTHTVTHTHAQTHTNTHGLRVVNDSELKIEIWHILLLRLVNELDSKLQI